MSKQPSKRYRAAAQVADLKAKYDIAQAAEIIKKMPGAKFDETVEISAFLGVDPKQSDQMVRGTVSSLSPRTRPKPSPPAPITPVSPT
jgi:large subunit ribosomal protein L1